jgi:hypothetical protein
VIQILTPGKWLPWLRASREVAMPTETPLDAINDALCRTADAARCWEVNPCIDNDRHLTQLVEQAQDAIARAYPPTEPTLRLLQHSGPDAVLARSGRSRRPAGYCCWAPIWLRPQDRAVYGQLVTYLGAGELYRACSRQLAAALDGVRPCPSRGSLLKSPRAIQAALDC